MMNDQRSTLLALVRQEIDVNLAKVAEAAIKHQDAQPGANVVGPCEALAHQVFGALRMVQLPGAARVASEIESALRAATRSAAADKAEVTLIGRAAQTLREFVNDVAGSGAYAPFKLYAMYAEVSRVSGNDAASEKDLFFPDLDDKAPVHTKARAITQAVVPVLVKDLRTRYQRGLLAWLKETAKPDGLKQMRDVLDGMHQLATQMPPPRGLWWASVTLTDSVIDLLSDAKAAEWLPRVKTAFSRLDFLLRDLAASGSSGPSGNSGNSGKVDTLPAQRDVYYAIATCRMPTPQLADACRLLNIEGLLGGEIVDDTRGNQPLIDDAKARLDNIKDIWTEYTSGEPKRLSRFRELLAPITQKARELGNLPLSQLLMSIHAATANLPDPYPLDGQVMSLEMASALLMAEDILTQYHSLPPDLEKQTAIMKDWLTAAADGKPASGTPPGLRSDIVQKVNDAKLRAATAREINKSLQQIEKVVEAFSRDTSKRAALEKLPDTLRQVRGVFDVFNEKRAAQLTMACQRLIERCANGTSTDAMRDVEWLAEGLGSLGFYLEPSLQGKPPAERAINLFFARHQKRQGFENLLNMSQPMSMTEGTAAAAATVASAPVTQPVPIPEAATESRPAPAAVAATPAAAPQAAPAAAEDDTDHEMLDIFLEEATEVLEALGRHIGAVRKLNADHDALINMRRAFHTLKGSSRMVGLTAFGDCAWELEQLMNGWLALGQPATKGLLDIANDARALLAEWTHALRGGEAAPSMDASEITQRSQAMRGVADKPKASTQSLTPIDPLMSRPKAEEELPSVTQMLQRVGVGGSEEAASGADAFKPLPASMPESDENLMSIPIPVAPPAALIAPSADTTATNSPPRTDIEQTLEDLGERLKFFGGLANDIHLETASAGLGHTRIMTLARILSDSLAEATAHHQRLQQLLNAEKK